MAKKKSKPGKHKGGKKGGKLGLQLMALCGLVTAFVFMPTTVMLCLAMLPTLAAWMSDRMRGETRALTIGSMNIAGTTPYLLKLWSTGHDLDNALSIITDPQTIIVIYCAAGVGWIIDWAIAGVVATVMQQGGVSRLKDIKERQEALAERWGQEVTGDLPLDPYGFPIEVTEEGATVPPPPEARRA